MTGSTPTDPNPLQAASSQLTFGAADYVAVMRGQVEMAMRLTTAWTAAVSALSSRMMVPGSGTGGVSTESSPAAWSNGFPGLRSVRDVGADRNQPLEEHDSDDTWSRPVFDRPAPGRMLRWLTELPTLQTNLFDEDIKTAS